MIKMIFIVVVALAVGVGGASAAFLMLGSDNVTAESTEPGVDQPVRETRDPIYWPLDPKFTITYNAGGLRYLQVDMEVMSYEQKGIDLLKANMPAVRNNVIMLLSAQEFESLTSLEGKEALRSSVLEAIQDTIGPQEKLEEVFFTTFIMQ